MDELGYRASTTTNQTTETSLNDRADDSYYNTRNPPAKSSQMDSLNYLDTNTSSKFKSSNNGYKANPPNSLNISTSISNLNNSNANTSNNNSNFYLMKKSPINENPTYNTGRSYRDASLNSLNTNNTTSKLNYSNNSNNFSNSQIIDNKQMSSTMSQKVLPQHMSLRNINDSGSNGLIQGPNSMSTGLMKNADVSFMKNNNNNFSSSSNFMTNNNNNSSFYQNQPQQQQQQKQLPSYSQLSIPNQTLYNNQSKQFNNYSLGSNQYQQQSQPQLNKSSSLISSTSPLQYYDNNTKNDTKSYDNWVKEKRVVSVSPTNTPIGSLSAKPLMGSSGSQTALNKHGSSKVLNAPITNKNLLPANKTFNLYSLLNPQHQRITQPYQQILLNHANLSKEEQELEEQLKQLQEKQDKLETDLANAATASASQQKKNQLNYQKTISKSFDSSSLNPSNDG